MLLASRIKDARILLGIGQMALVFGLVGLRLSGVFGGEVEKTFGTGFLLGLSGAMLGLSVPVNITALIRLRRERNTREF